MYLLLIGSYLHSKYEYQKVGIIGATFEAAYRRY